MDIFWYKLKRLKQVLRWWNKHKFGNIFSNIKQAEEEVNLLEIQLTLNNNGTNKKLLEDSKKNLLNLQYMEEIYWKLKAASKFHAEGDRNTKYFHAVVNKRKSVNLIHKIKDSDGTYIIDNSMIVNLAITHFQNLLASNRCISEISHLQIIPHLVTFEDNADLVNIPSENEIFNILMGMNKDSVSGLDGFTTLCFQKCWSILKDDLVEATKDFFTGSKYPKFFASYAIALIPKTSNPQHWMDFRPISLCTTFNKLISKIIANRLAAILPKIISANQTGFIKGRYISDNVLLA